MPLTPTCLRFDDAVAALADSRGGSVRGKLAMAVD